MQINDDAICNFSLSAPPYLINLVRTLQIFMLSSNLSESGEQGSKCLCYLH